MNTGRPPIDRKNSYRNRIRHPGMPPELRGYYDSGIDALPSEPINERLMGFADLHSSDSPNYSTFYGPMHVQSSPTVPRRVMSMPPWMNTVPRNTDAMTYRRVSCHAGIQQRECMPEKSEEFILRPPPLSLQTRTFGGAEIQKSEPSSACHKQKSSHPASFPVKLHQILSDPQYSEYITWLPHGRAFRILKAKAFEEIVIPRFLRSRRYASFMRQVNGWGFKRITEGPDLNAYYHEMFLRGLPELCAKMRRPKKADEIPRDLGESPDFYKISTLAPLPESSPAVVSRASKNRITAYSGGSSVSSNEGKPFAPLHIRSGPLSPGAHSDCTTPERPIKNRSPPFSRTSSLGSGIESITSWPDNYDSLWASAQPFSPVGQMSPRGQHEYSPEDNPDGLSLADLQYLTEQNRILLQQSRNRPPHRNFH